MNRSEIRKVIGEWKCVGHFGYGQGRAAAEFGDAVEKKLICHQLCPRSDKCQEKHRKLMDAQYPSLAQLVKRTAREAQAQGRPLVPTVVAAMTVAANTGNEEAVEVREGLKEFSATGMTDHYIYGQLANLHKGIGKRDPKESITSVYRSTKLISNDGQANSYTGELEKLLSVIDDK